MAGMTLDHLFRIIQIPIEAGVLLLEAAQEEVDGEEATIRIIGQMDDQTNGRDDVRTKQVNP